MEADQRTTVAQDASARGECPACAMPVPFKRANFKRGQAFVCKGCRRMLKTEKTRVGTAMAAFGLASISAKMFGFLAALAVLIALVIYEWLTVRVHLAQEPEALTQ